MRRTAGQSGQLLPLRAQTVLAVAVDVDEAVGVFLGVDVVGDVR